MNDGPVDPVTLMKRRPPSTAAWPYRCYVIKAAKSSGWRAQSGLEYLTSDIPRSFIWAERTDREGLKTYIDLVTAGRKSDAMEFQERGLVREVEYDPEPVGGVIKVQFERFIDLLAFRGHIDIPLCAKVQFVGKGGKQLVPAEFISTLMKYVPNPDWFGNPKDWHWVNRAELDETDPSGLGISSGMYRGLPNMVDSEADLAAQATEGEILEGAPSVRRFRRRKPSPARESEIRRKPYDKHFELITLATPQRGSPYFVRRLGAYNGALLWSGTAFSIEGPWTEHSRDDSQLLALGVYP